MIFISRIIPSMPSMDFPEKEKGKDGSKHKRKLLEVSTIC